MHEFSHLAAPVGTGTPMLLTPMRPLRIRVFLAVCLLEAMSLGP